MSEQISTNPENEVAEEVVHFVSDPTKDREADSTDLEIAIKKVI
ncbi:MAG: hypothetical protein ABSD85_11190 [Acidimicrobiales bacterium]|jgi:hypothetical protein